MAINFAKQYQQTLANAFPKVLHFGALWETPNKSIYKTDEIHANTIYLPTIDTTGRVNGKRGTIATAAQRHSNDWEAKTLTNHRIWDTLVHPQDVNQTNMALNVQNITKVYNEQQKFKEMDCYVSSKVYADWTENGGTADTSVLTKDTVLAYIATSFGGNHIATYGGSTAAQERFDSGMKLAGTAISIAQNTIMGIAMAALSMAKKAMQYAEEKLQDNVKVSEESNE